MNDVNQGRRAFLEGGALVLAFALLPRAARAEFNGMGVPPVANANSVNLIENIERLKLGVERILPLHGRVVPLSELYAFTQRQMPR